MALQKFCQYDKRGRCRQCRRKRGRSTVRECSGLGSWNLGDFTATALARLGITKRRYRAIKSWWTGEPATCGCEARQAALNRLGDWLAQRFRT